MLAFDEPVARMAVIIESVLLLQLLNVPEIGLRMRTRHTVAERLECVQERLFEAAAYTHPLPRG